jgi:hypothetical protein
MTAGRIFEQRGAGRYASARSDGTHDEKQAIMVKLEQPLKITADNLAWLRDVYRRIAAGESPFTLVISERVHWERRADKVWRSKVEEEATEARRRRGGRPMALSTDQISDAQAMVRQYIEANGLRMRWHLTEKAQEYLDERGIHVSDSTVIRDIVEPVRGKKRGKK